MKVTFILPCVGRKLDGRYPRSWQMEPLAIAQLSALTPFEWNRTFFDDRVETIRYDEATDLVAINVETYTARRAYQIADRFRQRGVPVVMGGFHATLVPDEVAAHADAVVVGEAEQLWPQLLTDYVSGKLQERYTNSVRSELTGVQPDCSIYDGKSYVRLALLETGRGCRYGCEFCSISSFFQRSYQARPIAEIVEEIRIRGSRNIFFVDDNIAVDPARTRHLLEALIPLRIRWAGQVSLGVANDEVMLELFRRSGCIGVLIGFESLNPQSIAQMGKSVNADPRNYGAAIGRLRRHGISIYATFLFGYDDDTEESFRYTLEFALQHRFLFAAFNHLTPFPGTPLYERLKREGRLLHESWWLAPDYHFGDVVFQPRRMSPQALTRLCYEFRHRFYSLSSIGKRSLDLQANCRDLFMTAFYFSQNLGSHFEVDQRQGLPLGVEEERPCVS